MIIGRSALREPVRKTFKKQRNSSNTNLNPAIYFRSINTYLLSLILTGERASFWIFFACYIIILKDKSMRELLK